MISTVVLVLFYMLIPAFILYLVQKFPILEKIGAVLLVYLIGLIVGNINVLPENAFKTQDLLNTLTIPLALPLMLFSSNVRSWFKIAHKAFISLVLGLIAVVISVFVGYMVLSKTSTEDLWKVGGMLIGVYSGGTPNLAALKMMLKVDENTYILTHTYDMVVCLAYLFFLMTIGKQFFSLFLPAFKNRAGSDEDIEETKNPYRELLRKKNFKPLLLAFGLSVLIFGVSGAISLLNESAQMTIVILSITTLALLASLVPSINKIKYTFDLGMYLILVFSAVVASMADISQFKEVSHNLLLYVVIVVFGSLFIHSILAKVFKIDVDTMIITSLAMIFSPPFVPLMAGVLKNKAIIISGLTVGLIGYAIGNYLGVFVAGLLRII